MRRFVIACALGLLSVLACAPVRPASEAGGGIASRAASPAEAAVTTSHGRPEDPALSDDPAREEFERRVLPILKTRCSPCHFEGGKMYQRLPFDRPGTIRVLGTALFTRIRDEEERQAIRDFLGATEDPPEDAPPPR